MKRAQGKPDASRIRWPCVQSKMEMHTSFQSPRDWPDIRLSLHDKHYDLFRALPGALSPVIASNALRLVTRLDDFAFVQLKHQPRVPGPHGFAVGLPHRPSCAPVMIAARTSMASAPRSFRDVPDVVSVHRIPARASDDGQRALSGPGTGPHYTRRRFASSENLRNASFVSA